jgi:hypothetical protein
MLFFFLMGGASVTEWCWDERGLKGMAMRADGSQDPCDKSCLRYLVICKRMASDACWCTRQMSRVAAL